MYRVFHRGRACRSATAQDPTHYWNADPRGRFGTQPMLRVLTANRPDTGWPGNPAALFFDRRLPGFLTVQPPRTSVMARLRPGRVTVDPAKRSFSQRDAWRMPVAFCRHPSQHLSYPAASGWAGLLPGPAPRSAVEKTDGESTNCGPKAAQTGTIERRAPPESASDRVGRRGMFLCSSAQLGAWHKRGRTRPLEPAPCTMPTFSVSRSEPVLQQHFSQ